MSKKAYRRTIVILITLIVLSSKWISIAVLGSLLVIMLVAQWKLIKTQTLDSKSAVKAA
jgi:hypothetical protein